MALRYRPTTIEAKLGWVVEECGEVLAAVGKTLCWGLGSSNPELPPDLRETNRAWVLRELSDLKAAIALLEDELQTNPDHDLSPPVVVETGRCLDCGRHLRSDGEQLWCSKCDADNPALPSKFRDLQIKSPSLRKAKRKADQ